MYRSARDARMRANGTGFLAGVFLLAAWPTITGAQQFGTLEMKPFNGVIAVRQKVVRTLPPELARVNVAPLIDAGWESGRGELVEKLMAKLRQKRFGGQTLHHTNISIAPRGRLLGNAGVIQYVVKGNRLTTKITTPDIGPFGGFGSYADPSFAVDFDIYVTMQVIANNTKVSVRYTTAEIKASRPRGNNVTGWLLQATADTVNFFGGPDGRSAARNVFDGQRFSLPNKLNAAMTPLNRGLTSVGHRQGAHMGAPGFQSSMMYFELYVVPANAGPPDIR